MKELKPTMYGVAYNDTKANGLSNKYHTAYDANLKRIYSSYWITITRPSYILASCSDDFLYESNYMKFRESNYYEYNHPITGKKEKPDLDKDILLPGNKHYSFDLIVYVPQFVNQAMTERERTTNLPVGVSKTKKGYVMSITKFGVKTTTKGYKTPEESHRAWQLERIQYLIDVADYYKHVVPSDKFDRRVYDVVLNKASKIMNEYDNKIETWSKDVEGIEFKGGKFVSYVVVLGEKVELGRFDDVMDAHREWQEMIIKLLYNRMDEIVVRNEESTVTELEKTLGYYQKCIDSIQCDIDNNLITTTYYKPKE